MKTVLFLSLTTLVSSVVFGQESYRQSYIKKNEFISVIDDARSGILNPAGLAYDRDFNLFFSLGSNVRDVEQGGIGIQAGKFGFAWERNSDLPFYTNSNTKINNKFFNSNKWTFSQGFGNKIFSWGYSVDWLRSPYDNDTNYSLGWLYRPWRFLSAAAKWENINNKRLNFLELDENLIVGISTRPYKEFVTVSAEVTRNVDKKKTNWKAGTEFNLPYGISVSGNYASEGKTITAGLTYSGGFLTRKINVSGADKSFGSPAYNLQLLTHQDFKNSAKTIPFMDDYALIKLSGNYSDEGSSSLFGGKSKSVSEVIKTLKNAKKDKEIKGIVIKIEGLSGGFIGPISANLEEIREAIVDFRESGKKVVAYLPEGISASEMYVASAASKIVIPRSTGGGNFGVSLEMNRLKSFFEKFGIEWDATTAGDYKSTFHTQYTDSTTSKQKELIDGLVKTSYNVLTRAIAEGRNIPLPEVEKICDGRLFSAEEMLRLHLIDRIGWYDEAVEELTGDKEVKLIDVSDRTYWKEQWSVPPTIAVVSVSGGINTGESSNDFLFGGKTMGSETVVKQIRKAAKQQNLAAIVLRVDSGGGSGIASDEILNAVEEAKEKTKVPIVVSMGNAAASGGYWISAKADTIVANSLTVTGSIGVVASKPVVAKLYEKLKIHNEIFKEGEHSDMFSASRKMTAEEKKMLDDLIDDFYQKFVKLVSEGRNLSEEEVRKVAGGRVWFGEQALKVKLIDQIGGLQTSIETAAKMAEVTDNYQVVTYSGRGSKIFNKVSQEVVFETLLKLFDIDLSEKPVDLELQMFK